MTLSNNYLVLYFPNRGNHFVLERNFIEMLGQRYRKELIIRNMILAVEKQEQNIILHEASKNYNKSGKTLPEIQVITSKHRNSEIMRTNAKNKSMTLVFRVLGSCRTTLGAFRTGKHV